jgi:hypothetical protein
MKLEILTPPRVMFLGIVLSVLVAAALRAPHAQSEEPASKSDPTPKSDPARRVATRPEYDEMGELTRPVGYETWVFVGSNMGLEYSEDAAKERPRDNESDRKIKAGNFHNVYINPEAYAHYTKTGEFPELTILVLDIYKSQEREPGNIVSEGLFPGEQSDVAVAVKNSARPDGSKTAWAYYDFGLDRATAKAFPNKACYDCHLQHADDDNVWVQFYPTLRKSRDSKARR